MSARLGGVAGGQLVPSHVACLKVNVKVDSIPHVGADFKLASLTPLLRMLGGLIMYELLTAIPLTH